MSIPINHHFVSQVHLKNFFNYFENKIYVYDKIKKNHYYKTTTKSLFSEKKLNSRYIDGKIDHITLEEDLNTYFEKDFIRNTAIIKNLIDNPYEFTAESEIALMYFAKYGIIGDMRTPRYKKNMDNSFKEAFNEIATNATSELKAQIEEMFEYEKEVKYNNTLDYSGLAETILESMGNLIVQITIPKKENDFFLIPDFSAGTYRAKINKYFNPDIEEIAYIGLPLTSKIYINFYSEKLFENQKKPVSQVIYCASEKVYQFNKANFEYSQSKVACENEKFLKNFISNI